MTSNDSTIRDHAKAFAQAQERKPETRRETPQQARLRAAIERDAKQRPMTKIEGWDL